MSLAVTYQIPCSAKIVSFVRLIYVLVHYDGGHNRDILYVAALITILRYLANTAIVVDHNVAN